MTCNFFHKTIAYQREMFNLNTKLMNSLNELTDNKIFDPHRLKDEERYTHDYCLALSSLSSKSVRVSYYLINHISEQFNTYHINRTYLAKKLNCSRQTISRAINLLKKDKFITVIGNYIELNYSTYDKEVQK